MPFDANVGEPICTGAAIDEVVPETSIQKVAAGAAEQDVSEGDPVITSLPAWPSNWSTLKPPAMVPSPSWPKTKSFP